MSSATRTILVTGFEPFGGETVNASWEAARKLEGWRRGEFTAVARLLPCAYDASVRELVQAIETLRPEAVLMTGQAAGRGVVCVERFARNLDYAAAPDNLGVLRKAVAISEGAPERLEAAAPVTAIAAAIRDAGIPAREFEERGGLRLQSSLFRRVAIPARYRGGDARRLGAPAGDAPTEAAGGGGQAACVGEGGKGAESGGGGDGRLSTETGMTGAPLTLGVDGGATRCRARLRDADGNALIEAGGAAANIHVDFAAAIGVLRAVVGEIMDKAGLAGADRARIAIGFGLAGFEDASDAAGVVEAFPGFRLVRAANDAERPHASAPMPAPTAGW